MKKFISGVIVGALLFGGTTVLADSIKNIVGAKVTGIYTVEQNGKKIADGAVINGSAYVPVRAMSEATGTGLTVKGKTIILEDNAGVLNNGVALSEEDTAILNKIAPIKNKILNYKSNIEITQGTIQELQKKIEEEEARKDEMPASVLDALKTNLAKNQAYVKEQEGLIAAAEAEIEELQSQLTLTNGNK